MQSNKILADKLKLKILSNIIYNKIDRNNHKVISEGSNP